MFFPSVCCFTFSSLELFSPHTKKEEARTFGVLYIFLCFFLSAKVRHPRVLRGFWTSDLRQTIFEERETKTRN